MAPDNKTPVSLETMLLSRPPLVLPRPPLPIIDSTTFVLPTNQYVPEPVKKTGIVLHHTVGGGGVGGAKSVYDWWLEKNSVKKTRVGTAYVINGDGTIYRFFPDTCWAWHLGKGVPNEDEARTIGIEICSEGPLVPKDNKLLAFYNARTGKGTVHKDEMVDLGRVWRNGWRYFDAYHPEQIRSVIKLVDYLLDTYNIPRKTHRNLIDYNPSIKKFEGVFTHAQVRPDKTDVHPAFPIEDVAKWTSMELL